MSQPSVPRKRFALADGSLVTLNTNSRVDVEITGNRRDVHLVHGEAYFDVVHDKTRPFTVYANRYVVRDIGTAFAVHLLEKGLVNVRVTKGSVEIAASTPEGKPSDGPKSLGIVVAGHDVVFGQKIERAEVVSDADLGRKQPGGERPVDLFRTASGGSSRRYWPVFGDRTC